MATNIDDFYRGDTARYKFSFQRNIGTTSSPSWVAIDITGWTLWFTMKTDADLADGAASLQVSTTAGDNAGGGDYPDNPAGGVVYIVADSDKTILLAAGSYQYDFQRVIPGTPPDVRTIQRGKVKVLQGVTESIA